MNRRSTPETKSGTNEGPFKHILYVMSSDRPEQVTDAASQPGVDLLEYMRVKPVCQRKQCHEPLL